MRNKEVFWPAVTQTRLEETQLQRKLNWNSWNHFKVSWRDVHQLRQRSVFHLCRREVWEGVCDRENASLQCIKGRNVVQLPRKTFFLLSQAWDKERKHIRSLTRTRTPDLRYCALMPCQWTTKYSHNEHFRSSCQCCIERFWKRSKAISHFLMYVDFHLSC